MWNTVLNHGYGYSELGGSLAKTTYLVCKIDGVPEPIIKGNDEGKHAEKQLVDILKERRLLQKEVTVYINNSPCAACANEFKDYLEENEDIHLTLYVTHLYNIRRRSCQDKAVTQNERHMKNIDKDEHVDNYKGLRDLMNLEDNRCKIEAFTEDVWRKLHEVMGLTEDCQQRMIMYAETKITDHKNKAKNHDRSRKTEDINIKNDLIHLKENADPWLGIKEYH